MRAFVLVVSLSACTTLGAHGIDDAGQLEEAGPIDAAVDTSVSDLIPPHPGPASVPAPPPMSCTGDVADGGRLACPLPAPVCADQFWQAYYDDGRCIAGQCFWVTNFYYCGALGCDAVRSSCRPHKGITGPGDGHH